MARKNKNIVTIFCDVCDNPMKLTGKIFMTYPAKREWKCPKCGYKAIIQDKTKECNIIKICNTLHGS